MTKPRIKLSGRQVNNLKSASAKRAWNGAVNRCLEILKKLERFKYITAYRRIILPLPIYKDIKKEILALKK